MINERGIWMSEDETGTHLCDKPLSDAIIEMFPVKSVIDIGCGNGQYTKNFLDVGIACEGYDGSPLTPEITGGLCKIRDFTQPVYVGKFDLVLCLEVGEHIPAIYERQFFTNLCFAAKEWICLSWGIMGQGGYGHINCHDNEYVINEMTVRGFAFDLEKSNHLRERSTLPWFENTTMVFRGYWDIKDFKRLI